MTAATAPRNTKVTRISVTIDADNVVRVGSHLERMRTKNPRLQISTTDAIRDLVLRGLDDAERAR